MNPMNCESRHDTLPPLEFSDLIDGQLSAWLPQSGLTTFFLFSRLPAEIRRKIWSFALRSEWGITTIIENSPYRPMYELHGTNNHRAPPAASRACYEARQVLEEERVRVYTRVGTQRKSFLGWIDPERHLFYFSYGTSYIRRSVLSLIDLKLPHFCELVPQIRHIAILPDENFNIGAVSATIRSIWGPPRPDETLPLGFLRTVTIIAPQRIIEDPTVTLSGPLLYYHPGVDRAHWAGDGLFHRPGIDWHYWIHHGRFESGSFDVDWTPLVRDLEAGGDPINVESPWGDAWAQSGFSDFLHGANSIKLYWRTPGQAMRPVADTPGCPSWRENQGARLN